MEKKTRLIIFLSCAALFIIITPYIIVRSLGYVVDFKKFKLVSTGGIYLKILPTGANIIIDSKIKGKNGTWSNSFLKQNILPGKHAILIKKDGYYDYQKFINVKNGEVAKLEHIILFKKNILFNLIKDDSEDFFMSPDGNYFLIPRDDAKENNFTLLKSVGEEGEEETFSIPVEKDKTMNAIWSKAEDRVIIGANGGYFLSETSNPKKAALMPLLKNAENISFNPKNIEEIFFIKNKNLHSNKQPSPITENIASYLATDKNIIWLSYDGFLYESNGFEDPKKITSQPFPANTIDSYEIIVFSKSIFLKENNSLFLLNQESRIFEKLYDSAESLKISPDGQKILIFNDYEILYYFLNSNGNEKVFLNRFSEKISDCWWLNDDYIIFEMGNKIIISEINNNENINSITLPQTISLNSGDKMNIENFRIFFNKQDKKLYILNKNNVLRSEKLTP